MSSTPVRHPAVAGRFYPGDPDDLRAEAREYLSQSEVKVVSQRAIGCMAPHAGYMYSGHVAGAVFAQVEIPPRCVLLCPNHTGMGRALAIMSAGAWETPLGKVPIDAELAVALKGRFPALQDDSAAHRAEHAAEVELPFLQIRQPELTLAVADVISAQSDRVLIVASSDMNHYESDAVTRVKDHRAIERILSLDPRGLFDVVTQQDISMCGFGPAVAMLVAARRLGAKSAELVKYATSGDVSGDRDMVVGYAGVVVG
jgi:MEMO1 family protein